MARQFLKSRMAVRRAARKIGTRGLLYIAGGALIVAAAIAAAVVFGEGPAAQESADKLLAEYEAANPLQQENAEDDAAPSEGQSEMIYIDIPEPDATPGMIEAIEGHDVIGKLTIDKIDVALPIIAKMSRTALKVSICYYQGVMPGEPGNLVITGHNYASGAHFGRLNEVAVGDIVTLSTKQGQIIDYKVRETLVVRPDEAEALDVFEDEYALTLLTCTSQGNRRLIVRCSRAYLPS